MKIKFSSISEEELNKLQPEKEDLKIVIPKVPVKKILIGLIIAGFLTNQFLLWKADYFSNIFKIFNVNIVVTKK
ncbi:hypothetical protein HYS95_00900 [Candidatus Daviesbacteria bacterium]|nr:hypothetical protein [Candidatus Daviesbacteria bacterium]